MNDEDVKRVAKFTLDVDLTKAVECKSCRWQGDLRNTEVLYAKCEGARTEEPVAFLCPECNHTLMASDPMWDW